jgi:hypothetical protein
MFNLIFHTGNVRGVGRVGGIIHGNALLKLYSKEYRMKYCVVRVQLPGLVGLGSHRNFKS